MKITAYLDHMDIGIPLLEFLTPAQGDGHPYRKVIVIHTKTWSAEATLRMRTIMHSLFADDLAEISYPIRRPTVAYATLYDLRRRVVFISHGLTMPLADYVNQIADHGLVIYGYRPQPNLPERFRFDGAVIATTTTRHLYDIAKQYLSFPSRVQCLHLARFPDFRED